MFKKISVIVLVLVFSLSVQVAADSARIGMSVRIIEPTQTLESVNTVSFNSDLADKNINEAGTVMEIYDAGDTVISSNLPWEIYADVPEFNEAEVYVKSNMNSDWVRVDQSRPVLVNNTLDRANLTWDVKVVADAGVEVNPFDVNFKIDWQRN